MDIQPEVVGDSYVANWTDLNFGGGSSLLVRTDFLGSNRLHRTYISFNTSSISSDSVITDAELCLYYSGSSTGNTTGRITAHTVYYTNFSETTINWENQSCGADFDNSNGCNLTASTEYILTRMDWLKYHCFNVTSSVQYAVSENINATIALKSDELNVTHQWDFNSKEGSNIPYMNVSYFIPIESVTILYPSNNSFLNYNESLSLNFSIVNNTNIDTCVYSFDEYSTNTSISGCLNTSFNRSEGNYLLRFWVNESTGTALETSSNFSVDLTNPSIVLHSVTPSGGSKVVGYNVSSSDTNRDTCFYSVYSSNGSIDNGLSNVSYTCNNVSSFEVSSFASFNVFFYVNDSSGRLNSSNTSFTTSAVILGGGGGGSGETEDGVCEVSIFNPKTQLLRNSLCPPTTSEFTGLSSPFSITLWNNDSYGHNYTLRLENLTCNITSPIDVGGQSTYTFFVENCVCPGLDEENSGKLYVACDQNSNVNKQFDIILKSTLLGRVVSDPFLLLSSIAGVLVIIGSLGYLIYLFNRG